MPQIQVPLFPLGVTHITPVLAFGKEDGRVAYFNGSMPVYVHVEPFLRLNAALQEDIETLQRDLNALQEKRKQTPITSLSRNFPKRRAFASSAARASTCSIH